MSKFLAFVIPVCFPTALFAQEETFTCNSTVNDAEYTLKHSQGTNEGAIEINGAVHQAQVLPGVNNTTYLIANDDMVVTVFLNKPELDYSLSEHRPILREDHGKCVAGGS